MDFNFTPDELAFRAEVEAFLRWELPEGWMGPAGEGDDAYVTGVGKQFTDRLAKKGWLAPAWPVEYGGLGLGYWKQMIYKDLMAYYQAPMGATEVGIDLERVGAGWASAREQCQGACQPSEAERGPQERRLRRHPSTVAQTPGDATSAGCNPG